MSDLKEHDPFLLGNVGFGVILAISRFGYVLALMQNGRMLQLPLEMVQTGAQTLSLYEVPIEAHLSTSKP